ncbi:MAG: prepilin-type N-terminal cleavage/methylation domain-containing protein [Pyrinomonadaceae bacterium]
MIKNGSANETARSREAGFSLLEMVIAILIFSIIMGVVYGLLEVARNDRLTTTERVESLQSIRVSLGAIGRDIHNAGFGFSNTGVSLTEGVVAANNSLHLTPDTYVGEERLTPTIGGNKVLAGTYVNPADQQIPETDQISLLYADASFFQPPLPPPTTPTPTPTPIPGATRMSPSISSIQIQL